MQGIEKGSVGDTDQAGTVSWSDLGEDLIPAGAVQERND